MEVEQVGMEQVEVEKSPQGMEEAYATLLTPAALQFVTRLTRQFNDQVDLVSTYNLQKKVVYREVVAGWSASLPPVSNF